jgi:hypothetical protein
MALRIGAPSAECGDSNDPIAGSAPRAGPVVEVSELSNPADLITGFGAGSGAAGLASLKPLALVIGSLATDGAATRGISGKAAFGISITGAEIMGAEGTVKCAGGGGRNSRGRGACIIGVCLCGGMTGVTLAGAINVKCSGAEGNRGTLENRMANSRKIARL